MSGKIYDDWTSEDFVRLNCLNLKRKLVALRMVRYGDRQDARAMRLAALTKATLDREAYIIVRNNLAVES